jgi:hypothetical protein
MNTLTQFQLNSVNTLTTEYTNKCLESNKALLFDIDGAKENANKILSELADLKSHNDKVIKGVKEMITKDFEFLQEFLGEYKDLVVLKSDDYSKPDFSFTMVLGEGISNAIWFKYSYGVDHFVDVENYRNIDDNHLQEYIFHGIEIYTDKVGEYEWHQTIQQIFEDQDYISTSKALLTQFIINESWEQES